MCEHLQRPTPIAECQIVLHCVFCKYTRHAHQLQRTMERELTCSSASLGFCPRNLKNISKVLFSHFLLLTHLITPPSCFTFISPVFFDSNAAKAFLNLKILSADMKSAILTPSNGGIYKCEGFWFWNFIKFLSRCSSELDSFQSPRLSNALLDVQLNFLGNWILSTCLFCSQSWEVTKCNVHKHDASSWRDVLTWEQICEKFHRLFSLLSGVWAARSGVFLGIFVFQPAPARDSPRLSEKTYWTSFRTFAKILHFLNIVDSLASNLLLQICLLLSH